MDTNENPRNPLPYSLAPHLNEDPFESFASLSLSSPADVALAVPHLLGFHPHESVVVLALSGSSLVCVMRMDLDAFGDLEEFEVETGTFRAVDEIAVDEIARQVAGRLSNSGADKVIVLIFSSGHSPEAMNAVGNSLCDALDAYALPCVGMLYVTEDGQDEGQRDCPSSGRCGEPECCAEGAARDSQIRDSLAAEFVGRGRVVMSSRDDLVMSVRAADAEFSRLLGDAVAVESQESVLRIDGALGKERWRDEQIDSITSWLAETSAHPVHRTFHPASEGIVKGSAGVLVGLTDIRVRDTVMHRLLVRLPSRSRSWDGFAWVLREIAASAPAGWRAPAATLAGLSMWQSGDGARALECLRMALEDDDSYSLAQLLVEAVCGGLPPETWAEALRGLSERECRYGRAAESQPNRRARRRSRKAS